ncbi:MAG: signal recognition particle protein [Candidatus Glassbacteria bacterium]|nr:signal recognition particle protein [Candidatus Glassbacteria bacterium]
MFEELTEKLEGVIRRLGGRAVLNETSIRESLREIRRVLLEADVNYRLVQDFLKRVEEQAQGREVIKSVSPGQMMVKIVYDELVSMLGGSSKPLAAASRPPTVIMLVGLQGSGKTTTAGKMALWLKNQGGSPLMIAADIYRPAAVEQLQTLGRDLDVPVHAPSPGDRQVESIITGGLARANELGADTVLIDTAGRLHIDRRMMDELVAVKNLAGPHEVLLVVDGMTGQDAVSIAQSFHRDLELSGLVLTKLDGDARGGAALSIYGVTRVPIKLIGVGEKLDALEVFHPDRMASRLLQMGDVVTLVERAGERMDQEAAEALEKKVLKHRDMDLEDFLSTLRQLQKLGPLESLLRMIPGVNSKMLKAVKIDQNRFKKVEAIILSMTPEERTRPGVLNASRRRRVAGGAGVAVQEVNQLVKQFDQMRKMMKKMGLFSGGQSAAMMRGGLPPF